FSYVLDSSGDSYTLSLSDPFDPSAADTSAGFLYSFATSWADLATSWSSTASASLTPTTTGGNLWCAIMDKDGGMSAYNLAYASSTINLGMVTDSSVGVS